MRNKAIVLVLVVCLIGLHLVILFAGFISPYDPATQDRELSYAPPTRVHIMDSSGLHWPFVYRWIPDDDGYREDVSTRYGIRFFAKGEAHKVLWTFRSNRHLFGVDAPARVLLVGADAYGRDELSRLLYGGQISLAVGLLATLITLVPAVLIGTVAGYYGKWIDESLMTVGEIFLTLPWFYFLVGTRAFLPLHVSAAGTFLLLIAVIGIIGWARPARLVRGIVLSARNRNYVLAARGFGGADFYLLRRHILPETFAILLTQAALLIPQYIAAEATLSFFGLGVSEPTPSWGNMMSALQQYSVLVSYSWLFAPAVALVITSVMYWLLADVLHHWIQSHPSN
jgi:peptide/nickel transport system permease protein